VFYWLVKVVLTPILRVVWRPWGEGLENVPLDGPVILASNHLAFCDSIFMPLLVPRKVTFLAKAEYFTGRGLKGWLVRAFFRGVGQVPIDRSGGSASQAALDTGVRLLREGHVLGIYPEGTRSPDGRLYRGRTGVAWMALQAGVPVVPCAMIGTDVINPPGSLFWKFRPRPGVRFGKPLDFSRYAGMEGDRFVLRSMTDELMYELMLLSGQEYVDQYATKAKAELERARRGRDGARTAPADLPAELDRRPQTRAS
jgi:1-acyl-sn-glycerol-3-phosphate acyltransferase